MLLQSRSVGVTSGDLRGPVAIQRLVSPSLVSCLTSVTLLTAPVSAQLTPDGTLGSEASIVTPEATVRGAPASLIEGGAQRGSNLFHSFSDFNVDTLQRVYFANPAAIDVILTRVTGGNGSSIDGTLGVDGLADLYLLNPNGVIFGANAQLDIQGSFVVSTADHWQLGNGEIFSAVNPDVPPLLAVTLTPGLQYGTTQQVAVTGDIKNRGQLVAGEDLVLLGDHLNLQGQVVAGNNLMLLGETVQIRDATDAKFVALAGGDLLVQGNQHVDIVALSHPDSGLSAYGDLVLRSANPVSGDAHYWSAGNFRVETLDGATGELFSPIDPIIRAFGDVEIGAYQGSSLHILAGGSVTIGTAIITAPDPGTIGFDFLRETITLSDGTVVEVDGGAQPTLDVRAGIDPAALGPPPGGVTGFDPATDAFFGIFSATTTPSAADIVVGDVFINAANGLVLLTNQYEPNLTLEGDITITGDGVFGQGINATGFATLSGQGGAVYLDARDDVVLINSAISTSGVGVVGDIVINAGETVRFERQDRFTGAASSLAGDGIGGNVLITANALEMLNGAQLSASTFGNGNAGSVVITARDHVLFEGDNTAAFSSVESGATGAGGKVVITTNTLDVLNGAQLQATTFGNGDAGSVVITASDRIRFDGTSANGLFASGAFSAVGPSATGTGGNVVITAKTLEVLNGAELSASTLSNGDAGNVKITASDRVVFDDSAAFSSVELGAMGSGGDVVITAETLEVLNGAQLQADTDGNGDAGNVKITARDRVVFDGTSATSPAVSVAFSSVGPSATGTGGNVVITAETLEVLNGAGLTAITQGEGDAGNIVVTVNTLKVLNGAQLQAATQGNGDAGNVEIIADGPAILQGAGDSGQPSGIFTSSLGFASGPGNNIQIVAPSLTLQDGAVLFASTASAQSGGDIVLALGRLDVLNGGQVVTSSFGSGSAGEIQINATEGIRVSGSDPTFAGRAAQIPGLVDIYSPQSTLSVQSNAAGAAGNIIIGTSGTTPSITLDDGGQIIAESASVDGGNISLNLNDFLLLRNGSLISTTAGTAQAGGDGGTIAIEAPFVVGVLSENSDITANAFQGSGGRVTVSALDIIGLEFQDQLTPFSDITASSDLGAQGITEFNRLTNVNVEEGLNELPVDFTDPTNLISQQCALQASNNASEFTVIGRGGLPPDPSQSGNAGRFLEDLGDPTVPVPMREQTRGEEAPGISAAPTVIREAQGWRQDGDRRVYLVSGTTDRRVVRPSLPMSCSSPSHL